MNANKKPIYSCLFASIRGYFLALALFCSLVVSRASAFDWTIFKQNGRDYIPLTDLARFYDFNTAEFSNGVGTLNCAAVHLQCASGSRDLYLNGLKFILNLPILDIQDRLYFSFGFGEIGRPSPASDQNIRVACTNGGH